jgi:hypothetical protein
MFATWSCGCEFTKALCEFVVYVSVCVCARVRALRLYTFVCVRVFSPSLPFSSLSPPSLSLFAGKWMDEVRQERGDEVIRV